MMKECVYLNGKNIAPKTNKDAKKLIGLRVQYLLNKDIDKTGRGYFFPRYGTITNVVGRRIDMDDQKSYDVSFSNLIEMVIKQ